MAEAWPCWPGGDAQARGQAERPSAGTCLEGMAKAAPALRHRGNLDGGSVGAAQFLGHLAEIIVLLGDGIVAAILFDRGPILFSHRKPCLLELIA